MGSQESLPACVHARPSVHLSVRLSVTIWFSISMFIYHSFNVQISRSLFKTLEDATLQQKLVTSLVTASEKSKSADVVNKVNSVLRQVLLVHILFFFPRSVNITNIITVKFDYIKPFGD